MDPSNSATVSAGSVDDFLSHFGVKGMHWGQRRKRTEHVPSEDSANATAAAQKAKIGGTKVLTNKELQDLINRLNLEQQFSKLPPSSIKAKAGKNTAKFIGDVLVNVGKQQVTKVVSDQATNLVKQLLKK